MRLYPDAVTRYLNDPTSGVNTDSSRKTYRTTLRNLQKHYPDHHVEDFTETELVDFCMRDLAPATIVNYRTRLIGFFGWAKWRGLIKEDPSEHLTRLVKGSLHKPVRQHHWLTQDQVAQVLKSIDTSTDQGLRAMVIARLGFTAGLRRQEISQLRWSDVDLQAQTIHLKGKGDKLATVYITDSTLPWLEKWHAKFQETGQADGAVVPVFDVWSDFKTGWNVDIDWSRNAGLDTVSQTVKTVSREAGLPFRTHDMRRSFANMLEQGGARIEDISAALRHNDLGTTQRYLEKRQDAAFKAVKGAGLNV